MSRNSSQNISSSLTFPENTTITDIGQTDIRRNLSGGAKRISLGKPEKKRILMRAMKSTDLMIAMKSTKLLTLVL